MVSAGAQELWSSGDTTLRATADIAVVISTGSRTSYVEYTNFNRENLNIGVDSFISLTCNKFFKATQAPSGRVIAVNKDFVKRISRRTGNAAYIYMLHSPTRYDVIESVAVLKSRLNLCSGGGGSEYQTLYIENDSLWITNGNGVPYSLGGGVYTAGVGIQIDGTRINNIGDTNPNDDVLKTTVHDGDVTGVYNDLVVKDGVITINKLDSANVLNWILDNMWLIDSTKLDVDNILTWIFNNIDTTDLDNQTLYISDDSICVTGGNCVVLDLGDVLPVGQRGETMRHTGSEWVADSIIYNDGIRVGIVTDTLFPGTLTVQGDTVMTLVGSRDSMWMRSVHKGDNTFWDYRNAGWFAVKDSAELSGGIGLRSVKTGPQVPRYRIALPGRVSISGYHYHTSGESVALLLGQDEMTGQILDFAPTSGSGTFSAIKIGGQINQISGTGITRGLHVLPAISTAADYRGVDIENSTGIGLRQSGANVTNRVLGKTSFASLLAPGRDIHNYGTTRLQTPVAGANGLAGVHLANGDISHVALGTGLRMSGDTLYAEVSSDSGDVVIMSGTVLNSTLRWDGSAWVENDSLLVNSQGEAALGMPINTSRSITTRKDAQINGARMGTAGLTGTLLAGGPYALTSGVRNTLLGAIAGENLSTGSYNVGLGYSALWTAVASSKNVALGAFAMDGHTLGSGDGNNVGIGYYAMRGTTSGIQNTVIGSQALQYNTTGGGNIAIGYRAGRRSSGTTGSYTDNIVIGRDAGTNIAGGAVKNIVIGAGIDLVSASDTGQININNAIYGINTESTGTTPNPNAMIGIKESAPVRELHVGGRLRVEDDASFTATKIWSGDANGDFKRLEVGDGIVISGDTVSSPEYYWTIEDADSTAVMPSESVLTVLGTGSVEVGLDPATRTLTINGLGPAGSGGEINVGVNIGAGAQIYAGKSDTILRFRTIVDQGIASVTQAGDTVVVNVPAQTLSTSNDSIYISLGNGIKVPNVPPSGTVLNSTLRWDGSNWVENDSLLVNSQGEAALGMPINTSRSLRTRKDISVDSIDVGRGLNGSLTNTRVGYNALASTTSSINTTAVGRQAGASITTGYDNTLVGHGVGLAITTGPQNTGVGRNALQNITTGQNNTGHGSMTLFFSSSSYSTAVGAAALRGQTTSGSNSAVGFESGYSITGAGTTFNTFLGTESGRNATGNQGSTFVGAGSGYNSTSKHSVFLGRNSGYSVTKDSTMVIEPTSDTVATIVGDFRNKRVGINRNPWGIEQTLDVGGTLRVRSDVGITPTRLWSSDTNGDFRRVKLGTNLSFSGDTLNASASGLMWGDVGPEYLVGTNADNDTLQKTVVPYIHPDGGNHQTNVRLQNDTLVGLRGSYFQAYQNTTRVKTLNAGAIDTIRMSTTWGAFDWTAIHSTGRFELDFAPEDKVIPPALADQGVTHKRYLHRVSVNATIYSDGSSVNTKMYLYKNGSVQHQCQCEWTGNPVRENVSFDCLVEMDDAQYIDVRLHNDSGVSNQYIIYKVNITANHIKTLIYQPQ